MTIKICDIEVDVRFSVLAIYFELVTVEQLVNEDLETFTDYAEPKPRILMSIFVHQFLTPRVQSLKMGYQGSFTRTVTLEDGILNCLGCLKSRSFPFSPKLCVSDLDKEIKKLDPKLDSFAFVDLSANHLLSGDLQYVYKVLEYLNPYLKSDSIISLEDNRIHGIGEFREIVDRYIAQLVNLSNVGHIDLKSNPFCSVDRKDFFKNLGVDDVFTIKLIWVEQYHLSTFAWTDLVKSEEVVNAVKSAHSKYYDRLNSLNRCI
jgi:hypothetical protein